jgi:eukaryotic-like serine/threonine-protein kinase
MTLPDDTVTHLRRVLRSPELPGNRYEIGEPIGHGGMGTVYRASDRSLGRDVALKVLRADVAGQEAAVRLEREARILARLEHPGIVPVHDVGVLADGRVFYVMKLVRGERLHDFARRAGRTDVLRVFLRVCETVGFAHAHGVVHRDLKPSNIMVGSFGEVLVLDWGIARVRGTAEPNTASSGGVPLAGSGEEDTAPGVILGTPGFMAPEQAGGLSAHVDGRTDVYALGAILRTVAGTEPVSRPLEAIWNRALSPHPAGRYASAEALAADITRFLDALPVAAYRESLGERAGRIFRKYQTAIILILTYLAVRLLFLAMRGL